MNKHIVISESDLREALSKIEGHRISKGQATDNIASVLFQYLEKEDRVGPFAAEQDIFDFLNSYYSEDDLLDIGGFDFVGISAAMIDFTNMRLNEKPNDEKGKMNWVVIGDKLFAESKKYGFSYSITPSPENRGKYHLDIVAFENKRFKRIGTFNKIATAKRVAYLVNFG